MAPNSDYSASNKEKQLQLAIRKLLEVIDDAEVAICDSINLDLAVGNDDSDDVEALNEVPDRLAEARDFAIETLRR